MKFLTETSAISDNKEIISFYPCYEGGQKFLYGIEESSCVITPYRKNLLEEATHFYKICPVCFKPITGKTRGAKYCSPYCRISHHMLTKKISTGVKITENHLESGYYKIFKTESGYRIELRGHDPLDVEIASLDDLVVNNKCIWKPRCVPIVINDKLYFSIRKNKIQKTGSFREAFLKIILENKIWN